MKTIPSSLVSPSNHYQNYLGKPSMFCNSFFLSREEDPEYLLNHEITVLIGI
jgi:hypothetical protein